MAAGNNRKENTFRPKASAEVSLVEVQPTITEEAKKEEKTKKEISKKSEKTSKRKDAKPQKDKPWGKGHVRWKRLGLTAK